LNDPNELLGLIRKLQESPPEATPLWLAKRRLAAAVRRMNDVLCDSQLSPETGHALADRVAEHADLLERDGRGQRHSGDAGAAVPGMETFYDRGPIAGRSNPIAPPASLGLDVDAQRVVGEVIFGKAFEGAPGCVHGGLVAAVLDEALGMACIFGGAPAMTAELTTRYLRHTPIEKTLRIEARLDEVDGRKVRTSGHVECDGVTVVDSTGLFIIVGTERFEALVASQLED
jgi:acyl-coenzyme A thioesterase PaaI-like protein